MSLEGEIRSVVREVVGELTHSIGLNVRNPPANNNTWVQPSDHEVWCLPQIGHIIEIDGFEYKVVSVNHKFSSYYRVGHHCVSVEVELLNPEYERYDF